MVRLKSLNDIMRENIVFSRIQGRFVSLRDTIRGFSKIVTGDFDRLSEGDFYMIGSV